MGQSMGGGSIPFMKKMSHLITLGTTNKDMAGPLSFKDRERISRNVVGLAAVFGAYQYSKLGDAGDEVTQETFGSGENKGTVDTTFIYPIAQIRYIGNALHRMEEGTFQELFDPTEFKDLFLSGAMRSASKPFSLIEDLVSSFEDADITTSEKIAATGGKFLSAYFSRWLTQDRQWANFKTAFGGITGSDDLKVRDLRADEVETFSPLDSFVTNFTGPMRQARFGVSQEDIAKAPLRQDIFKGTEGTTLKLPIARLFGINVTSPTPPDGAFLKRYNYNWRLGSRSKHKGLKRVEDALFIQAIPEVVAEGRRVEKESKNNYANQNDVYKSVFTLQEHTIKNVRKVVDQEIKLQRKIIREERWDEANFSEYQEASIAYRKLTTSQRTTAYSEFLKIYGRKPNYYNVEDLIELKGLLEDLK